MHCDGIWRVAAAGTNRTVCSSSVALERMIFYRSASAYRISPLAPTHKTLYLC